MSLGHVDVKRKGIPKAINKDEGNRFLIEVNLNVSPDYNWQQLFRRPSTFTDNESYPGKCMIFGDKLSFYCSEMKLKENIEWLDNYISQANKRYRELMAKLAEDIKKQQEREALKAKEIERINRELEKF